LFRQLVTVLHKKIGRSNIYSAIMCRATTSGGPVADTGLFHVFASIRHCLVVGDRGHRFGFFLVRYGPERSGVHRKTTFLGTIVIVAITVIASLIVGGSVKQRRTELHSPTNIEIVFSRGRMDSFAATLPSRIAMGLYL